MKNSIVSLTLAFLAAAFDSTEAATKTWTGGGATANWSTAANWNPSGAPTHGDELVFPSGASRMVNTNNVSNLRVDHILITDDGYTLRGNGIFLTNGMLITYGVGLVTVAFDITLGGGQNWDNRGPLTSFSGDLNLNGHIFIAHARNAGESLIFAGAITGPSHMTCSGPGLVAMQGAQANTYGGRTTVSGNLRLNKINGVTAVPQALIVEEGGTVTWFNNEQVADHALVTVEGSLDLNDEDETVGGLDLEDASIITGTGVLTLNGSVTNRASSNASIIAGTLHLGQFTRSFVVEDGPPASDLFIAGNVRGGSIALFFAGINKFGDGALVLSASNSFAGPITVHAGELRALNNDSLGTATGGTIVSNGASLVMDGLGTIAEPLMLTGAGVGGTNGALRQLSGITANGAEVTLNRATRIVVEEAGTLTLSGEISGAGPLVKDGFGTMYLSGAIGNTFTLGADVFEGTMFLNKSVGVAIPGNASVGKNGLSFGGSTPALLRQLREEQITGSVTVNGDGTWDLNNLDESILDLFLNGHADVTTGNGRLSVRHITATPDAFIGGGGQIDGFVELSASAHTFTVNESVGVIGSDPNELEISASIIGGGGFTKTGSGDLWLTSSNTFLGTATVNQGELRVGKNLALGSTFSGTVVEGSGVLSLMEKVELVTYGGVRITNEVLELDSVGEPGKGVLHSSDYAPIWKGQVILHQTAVINTTTNTTYENWASVNIEGNVSGPGGITKTGPGTLIFLNFGVNSYEGTTTVNEGHLYVARLTAGGAIPGDLIVGDGIGGPDADVVEVGTDTGLFFGQIVTNAAVHINSSGLLKLATHVPHSLISLTGNGRIDIDDSDTLGLGAHNSSYTFDGVISGSGALFKGGNGTVTLNGTNTFTGETGASQGILLINGRHTASPIIVSGLGRLGGSGRVSELTAFSATRVLPGASPGRLRASDVELRPNSMLDLELNGPDAGTNYDQLAVSGSLSVSNSILRVAMNFLPTEGQVFKIIDKTSAGPVLGTFADSGEGDIIYFGGFDAVLSYVGGDGNDVTLTVTNRFVEFYNAEVTMGNGNGFIDPNECNHLKIFVRNISGASVSISNVRLDSDTPGLIITAQEWTTTTVANNALFSNARPVQFRTTPEFPCGTTANFSLTLSANAYKLRIPFSVYVPASGGYFGFNALDTPKSIPDGGSVISTIPVPTNATLSLLNADRVEVIVHATHPRVSDLTLRLITPRGTNILLSANRGGNGTNYGTGCTFSNLTFFSDTAPLAIAAGTAPFVGSFRPEQPLSLAQGEPLSGTWQLMVEDSVGGNAGTLECWFLRLIRRFVRTLAAVANRVSAHLRRAQHQSDA